MPTDTDAYIQERLHKVRGSGLHEAEVILDRVPAFIWPQVDDPYQLRDLSETLKRLDRLIEKYGAYKQPEPPGGRSQRGDFCPMALALI